MKICVYAICKNEKENIPAWVKSMSEADAIYVLDTGSDDGSFELLKELGVKVQKKVISPWRFDVARNESLKMIDEKYDLYVCTDIDERFNEGWRDILEKSFPEGFTRARYLYNWSFRENGTPGTTYYLNKIHNGDYKWTHPVHEVLSPLKEEKEVLIEGIVLNHYQKPKEERSNYLPLLELSVKESPEDDRNVHYLGREYMYYDRHHEAIEMLHRHLRLPSATWKDERCASMRFMARCYSKLGFNEEAQMWYEKAIEEAPYLREPYVELAFLLVAKEDYEYAFEVLNKAFAIENKSISYINEEFAWNWQIYDLYAVSAYYLNKKDIARKAITKAISLDPENKHLQDNYLIINQSSVNNES